MKEKYALGIELGSTRIKAVLINQNAEMIAQGSYEWENTLVDGLWSYSLSDVEQGLQQSYRELAKSYRQSTKEELVRVDAIGISAMMHGYLAFDKNDNLLVPFRTWRNTNTDAAASELSALFSFNVPQRWSISQYYQAILLGEPHIRDVAYLTTLSGYVHYRLTGRRVLGIGDASGMFPIDGFDYNKSMTEKFNTLQKKHGIDTPVESILPTVLRAGEDAGTLTPEGAKFLDTTGKLQSGCPLCPPEGDMQTGMVATNSVTPGTANISAGTSGNMVVVLEKNLNSYYREIDVVTTPSGAPVAMVHVNNFTSEITAWTNLFEEVITIGGGQISRGKLFDALYNISLDGESDCGGLVGYNYLSGETLAETDRGIPMILRAPEGRLTLANFMKMQIFSALGLLAMGCELLKKENVKIDSVYGHGGFFKAPYVGQNAMSAAIGVPITVMKNAGEGGAWGIALLALYLLSSTESLDTFLSSVFSDVEKSTITADEATKQDFAEFIKKYRNSLAIERLAANIL